MPPAKAVVAGVDKNTFWASQEDSAALKIEDIVVHSKIN